eukprot:1396139-Rhodomonas_salina.2
MASYQYTCAVCHVTDDGNGTVTCLGCAYTGHSSSIFGAGQQAKALEALQLRESWLCRACLAHGLLAQEQASNREADRAVQQRHILVTNAAADGGCERASGQRPLLQLPCMQLL